MNTWDTKRHPTGSGKGLKHLLPTRGGTGGEGTGPSGNGGGFDSSTFSYPESEKKYDGYLLDENHPKGGSKAKFLKDVLGYQKGDGPALHNAIGEVQALSRFHGVFARILLALRDSLTWME